ncbi:hypothetical protein [Massilia glaciei]|nr:hypothetical protein [Massilia glaciei]
MHAAIGASLASLCLPAFAIDWSGVVDMRAVYAHADQSWTREGLGKLRYDGSNDGLRLGQAMLRGQAELADTVSATLVLSAEDDRNGIVDVTEAWLRWSPLPSGPWKTSVRAGAFFSPMSLENNGIGWTPTRTISTSAINSWIGEELRTRGLEVSTVRRGRMLGQPHDVGFSASVFDGNDAAGSLLAWRGWSISDRITGLSEPLLMADLPVYRPDGRLKKQWRSIRVFKEIDDRIGFQLGAQYGYGGWLELAATKYDNRANPTIIKEGQYSWRVRFEHVSARVRAKGWEVLFQAMDGQTWMGAPGAGVDFRAWFLLASHPVGAGKVSLRYDRFKLREDDVVPEDPNGEHGGAVALAYARPLTPKLTLVAEALAVDSTRPARALLGDAPHQRESSVTTSLRWRF